MRIAPDRLNKQALTLEEAQTEIRLAVKDAAFKGTPRSDLDKKIRIIILKALGALRIPDLKRAAYVSLLEFYQRQRRIAEQMMFGGRLLLFLALTKLCEKSNNTPLTSQSPYTKNMSLTEARKIVSNTTYIPDDEKIEVLNYAPPLNKYYRDYMRYNIKPYIDRMAEDEAQDPDAEANLNHRSSLRNRAEREVRHEWQLDQLNEFRSKGVSLVIASTHADCSERCRPWQGRVYSLDGSQGVTDDGRPYVPLEEATNILTKNGKWFNGLLGFNCRHYLVEYKPGRSFPKASQETEKKQYEITQRQRALERNVRKWRIEAEINKGVYPDRYKSARAKAIEWNKRYVAYSKKHQRAYYPTRVQLL